MFWTLELASHLEEAPWPATKDELIDYAIRSGAQLEVIENLHEHFTSQSTLKQIVKKLLKQDFASLSIPQNISNYSFTEYGDILEMFYKSKPEK
jgi:hypothetical protein